MMSPNKSNRLFKVWSPSSAGTLFRLSSCVLFFGNILFPRLTRADSNTWDRKGASLTLRGVPVAFADFLVEEDGSRRNVVDVIMLESTYADVVAPAVVDPSGSAPSLPQSDHHRAVVEQRPIVEQRLIIQLFNDRGGNKDEIYPENDPFYFVELKKPGTDDADKEGFTATSVVATDLNKDGFLDLMVVWKGPPDPKKASAAR